MNRDYRGIIVEESLDDNRLLNTLHISKVHITGQANPANRWHMYEVTVSEEEIVELSKHVIGDWYMHFWKGTKIIAVFSDRAFTFDYDDRSTWREVLDYGRSLGLPEAELDFPVKGL